MFKQLWKGNIGDKIRQGIIYSTPHNSMLHDWKELEMHELFLFLLVGKTQSLFYRVNTLYTSWLQSRLNILHWGKIMLL